MNAPILRRTVIAGVAVLTLVGAAACKSGGGTDTPQAPPGNNQPGGGAPGGQAPGGGAPGGQAPGGQMPGQSGAASSQLGAPDGTIVIPSS